MKDLKELAKELYFKDVKNEEYRNNFIEKLEAMEVLDKRMEGYRCSYCKKIAATPTAFPQKDKVIFPPGNQNEIWIINTHYDGCRGWD